jgi:HK97 family phage portal protein
MTLSGGATYSGETVSVERSLRLVPVWACVNLIAGGVGSLPFLTYRDDGKIRQRITDHRGGYLLGVQPNPYMAASEFWEIIASHLNLWGNAYVLKIWDDGNLQALWPISPYRVSVEVHDDGSRTFWVDGEEYTSRHVLAFRGLSENGESGYSPIGLARNQIGNLQAQEKYQGSFLRDEGRPHIILRHPGEISDAAAERLKARWSKTKAGGIALLEEGIEVEKWSMPLDDAQFIEQQEYGDLQIARLFSVPPGRIGAKSGDSLTYKTTESEWLSFVTYTLRRWTIRIEDTVRLDRDLYPDSQVFSEFLIDALQRADTATRYRVYSQAIDKGILTVNEARAKENLPPVDGGDAVRLLNAPPKEDG